MALSVSIIAFSTGLGQASAHSRLSASGLTVCRVDGVEGTALCGQREVPENRDAGGGRRILLNVVVLPATADSVADDAVFFLAGGGVVPATRYARFLATSMRELRRHHDIVLVDQRGTGGSNPLTCERATLDTASGLPPDERYLRYIGACRESLQSRADVRLYTTTHAVRDLDDVRAWLGYRTIDLFGASYGTSVAATYVRTYPEHVRSVVMHGVVPVDVSMQADLARSAQRSLERVVDLCAADATCRQAFPTVRDDLARVTSRSHATIAPPLREALNAALSSIEGIRSVPMLLRAAVTGTPPADARSSMGEPPPLGVRLAILCSEGLSNLDRSSIADATRGTFLGDFPVRFQLRWCDGWPIAPLASGFRAPFRSAAPALLLTGDLDPITPPLYAERVGAWFSSSTVLTLPHRSHSDTDRCVTGMIEAFIISGGRILDTTCLARTPPIVFRTER